MLFRLVFVIYSWAEVIHILHSLKIDGDHLVVVCLGFIRLLMVWIYFFIHSNELHGQTSTEQIVSSPSNSTPGSDIQASAKPIDTKTCFDVDSVTRNSDDRLESTTKACANSNSALAGDSETLAIACADSNSIAGSYSQDSAKSMKRKTCVDPVGRVLKSIASTCICSNSAAAIGSSESMAKVADDPNSTSDSREQAPEKLVNMKPSSDPNSTIAVGTSESTNSIHDGTSEPTTQVHSNSIARCHAGDLDSLISASDEARTGMATTCCGRAWKLVEAIQTIVKTEPFLFANDIVPIALDEMFDATKDMMQAQVDFALRKLPTKVDIGYHYTRRKNLPNIRRHGLMSLQERSSKKIQSNFNGASWGDGVYTGNDPDSFRRFGDVGLVVARLQGRALDYKSAKRGYERGNTSITRGGSIVVLQNSNQCLPLFQYPAFLSTLFLTPVIVRLEVILGQFFNDSLGQEEKGRSPSCYMDITFPNPILYTAPSSLAKTCGIASLAFVPQEHGFHTSCKDCAVCHFPLQPSATKKEQVLMLYACHHQFHSSCLQKLLKQSHSCPICQASLVGTPQGIMPSGTMRVEYCPSTYCKGFENSCGSIAIHYIIPVGIQCSYHKNPGLHHRHANRTAYLPNNEEGRALLKRLQLAFQCGLTFSVGTSLTTGKPNSVVWSSIPHKTRLSGGVYGFPDPKYFAICNGELDALGVPRFVDCS